MKTITINVPDDCEVKIIKKEEKKKPVIRTFEDLISNKIKISGYFISSQDATIKENGSCDASEIIKDVASSYKVAKSMQAMAMISQLMPYYGQQISNAEWGDFRIKKYILNRGDGNKILKCSVFCTYSFLAFHTAEQRNDFLKYNERLVKDYLMID